MNGDIRISKNDKFNKNFTEIISAYFEKQISPQKFKEINFAYLFNLPEIIERNNELRIRINEDIEKFKWESVFIKNIEERKNKVISKLKEEGYNIEIFSLNTSWRLIIGLGASHPQETSMTLHHIYGLPYIPGSAVKGVTRHWAVVKFSEKNKKNNEKFEDSIKRIAGALENGNDLSIEVDGINFKNLIDIFGKQDKQGKVIFFDAYPIGNINLKIDVMNPHYPKYYSEGKPPTDWQNPVPIKFLTIENTKFQFYLAAKDKDLLTQSKSLLLEALEYYGIGAKTSLGYGMFINEDKL